MTVKLCDKSKVNINPKLEGHKFKLGEFVKVTGKRSGHSASIGAKVQIVTISIAVGSNYSYGIYPYYICSEGGLYLGGCYEDELEKCITIKAYAYKKDNEFHWFSTEKARKGYERFPTHDIEKYI